MAIPILPMLVPNAYRLRSIDLDPDHPRRPYLENQEYKKAQLKAMKTKKKKKKESD